MTEKVAIGINGRSMLECVLETKERRCGGREERSSSLLYLHPSFAMDAVSLYWHPMTAFSPQDIHSFLCGMTMDA